MQRGLPDNSVPLVIDAGSYETRIGFANEAKPRFVTRTILQKVKSAQAWTIGGASSTVPEIGRTIPSCPIDQGIITSPIDLGRIIDAGLDACGFDPETVCVNGIGRPVVITEAAGAPTLSRAMLQELFIQGYRAPAVAVVVSDLCAAVAACGGPHRPLTVDLRRVLTPNCLVIGANYSSFSIIPVSGGFPVWRAARRLSFGSEALSMYARELIATRWPQTRAIIQSLPNFGEDFKRQAVYCCTNCDFDWMQDYFRLTQFAGDSAESEAVKNGVTDIDELDRIRAAAIESFGDYLLAEPPHRVRDQSGASTPLVPQTFDDDAQDEVAEAPQLESISVEQTTGTATPATDLIPAGGSFSEDLEPEQQSVGQTKNAALPAAGDAREPPAEDDETKPAEGDDTEKSRSMRREWRMREQQKREKVRQWRSDHPEETAEQLHKKIVSIVLEITAILRREAVSRRSVDARYRVMGLGNDTGDADTEAQRSQAGDDASQQVFASTELTETQQKLEALRVEAQSLRAELDQWIAQTGIPNEYRFAGVLEFSSKFKREYEAVRAMLGEMPQINAKGDLVLHLAAELFAVPELIWQPAALAGEVPLGQFPTAAANASATATSLVARSIQLPGMRDALTACAKAMGDAFGPCCEHVYLVGATAAIRGFDERLKNEIQRLCPAGYRPVKVTAMSDPLAAWIGASGWANSVCLSTSGPGDQEGQQLPLPDFPLPVETSLGVNFINHLANHGFMVRREYQMMPEGTVRRTPVTNVSWFGENWEPYKIPNIMQPGVTNTTEFADIIRARAAAAVEPLNRRALKVGRSVRGQLPILLELNPILALKQDAPVPLIPRLVLLGTADPQRAHEMHVRQLSIAYQALPMEVATDNLVVPPLSKVRELGMNLGVQQSRVRTPAVKKTHVSFNDSGSEEEVWVPEPESE